jgi:hypothetical protein
MNTPSHQLMATVGAGLPRDNDISKRIYRGVNPGENPLLHPTKPKQASAYQPQRG